MMIILTSASYTETVNYLASFKVINGTNEMWWNKTGITDKLLRHGDYSDNAAATSRKRKAISDI